MPAADALSDGAQNVRLVGYSDLQGRESLVVTTKSDPANGYPITGKAEDRCGPRASNGRKNDFQRVET